MTRPTGTLTRFVSGSAEVDIQCLALLPGQPEVRARALRLAAQAKTAIASTNRGFAREGARIVTGASFPALIAGAAGRFDKTLKGAKVAELPVRLALPAAVLARADGVID